MEINKDYLENYPLKTILGSCAYLALKDAKYIVSGFIREINLSLDDNCYSINFRLPDTGYDRVLYLDNSTQTAFGRQCKLFTDDKEAIAYHEFLNGE